MGVRSEVTPNKMVEMGNALAEIALRLAHAQRRAKGYFQIEQPASSIMLMLPDFKKLLAEGDVHMTGRHVCVDSAPWKKPTAIIANH